MLFMDLKNNLIQNIMSYRDCLVTKEINNICKM